MKFNIFGFRMNYSNIDTTKWKHCVVHPAMRLVSKLDEPGVLWCPLCGTPYHPKDTATEEIFEATANPNSQTRIFTAKSKKKYYDKQGNLINDQQLLKDIASGKTVISCHEYKVEGDSTKPKRIVRRK